MISGNSFFTIVSIIYDTKMNTETHSNPVSKHKRIGILTFHYAVNPGSALQAFGLLKTINSLDPKIKCYIINYQGSAYPNYFASYINPRLSLFKPIQSIKGYIKYFYRILFYNRYQLFWHNVGGIEPKRRIKEEDLAKLSYDIIVAGSDQIWNIKLATSALYFLPFCKDAKKVSYAASIGTDDFPEEDKTNVAGYLKDFSFLSVREPQAQVAIERLIGRKPELVIDPSLLLTWNDYTKMAKFPRIKRKYIFLYLRHKDSEVVPYARKMADSLGLQIVECHPRIKKIYSDDKIVLQPGPKEWLGWLLNAEYVFTDSFHGCAFCINCNKQFFVKVSSANSEMSSRIIHILDKYGMQDRLIKSEKDMFSMPDIDFSKSNALLVKDREDSIAYLKSALGV